jgi:16S rRNA (uracil1498-N3)-methyltransferase
MARFFLGADGIQGETFVITGDDSHHIQKVLRLKTGEEIEVVTTDGLTFFGKITTMDKLQVQGEIIAQQDKSTEPPINVVLIQGLPKGEKMELIIQKATELGVREIWPVNTTRSIVKLEPKKAEQRVARWQKIAQEAAKQSKRSLVPRIKSVLNLKESFKDIEANSAIIIPWEEEKAQGIKGFLDRNKETIIGQNKNIYILIGPEGGLAAEEVEKAREAGGISVTLGPRILRTETAGLAVITMVLYHIGDLGGLHD